LLNVLIVINTLFVVGGIFAERNITFEELKEIMFSTPDRINDGSTEHCIKMYGAGWWIGDCEDAYLNAQYSRYPFTDNMNWPKWKASLMMVKEYIM
jgi:hypothetical protein